jgi:hypothetical protein
MHHEETFTLYFGTKTVDLVILILNFDLVLKNLNLGYIFLNQMFWGFGKWDIDAWWRDLSFGTKTFDLVTLNFDLVLKSF